MSVVLNLILRVKEIPIKTPASYFADYESLMSKVFCFMSKVYWGFFFLPRLQHVEVPGLGTEPTPQPINLSYCSNKRQILNPLSRTRTL